MRKSDERHPLALFLGAAGVGKEGRIFDLVRRQQTLLGKLKIAGLGGHRLSWTPTPGKWRTPIGRISA
jgi:hypothetical protein